MSDLAWVFEAPKASAARVFEAPNVFIVSSAFAPTNVKLQNAFQAPGRSKSTDIDKKDGDQQNDDQEENDMATTSTTMEAELLEMLEYLKTKDEKEFDSQGYFQSLRRTLPQTSSTAEEIANELETQLNSNERQASALVSHEDAKNMANAILDKKVENNLGETQATIKEAILGRTAKAFEPFMAASLKAYSKNTELLKNIMRAEPTTLTELTPAKLKLACFQAKHLYNWNLVWYYILKNLKDWVEKESQRLPKNQDFRQVLTALDEGNDTFELVHSQLVEDYKEFEKEREIETKTGVLSWSMDFVENIDNTTEELSIIAEDSSMTLVERRHKLMDKMLGNLVTDTPCQPVQSITPHTATLYTVIQEWFDKYEDGSLSDSESPEFQSWLSAFDLVTHWNHLAAECKAEISSIGNRTSTSSSLIPAIPAISMYRKEPPNKEIIVQALRSEYERMLETLTLNDDEHMDVEEQKRHQELVDLFRTVAAFEAEVREKSNDKNFQVELGKRSELLQAFKEIDEYESADTVKRKGANNGTIEFTELYSFLKKDASNYTDYLHKVHSVLKEHLEDTKSTNWDAISNLFKDIDLNKDSIVDTCEFLRYMVLAMHSHPHLQDDLKGLTTVTGHLMDHSEVMENVNTRYETLYNEFENFEETLNKQTELFYTESRAVSNPPQPTLTKILQEELMACKTMFDNGVTHLGFLIETNHQNLHSEKSKDKKSSLALALKQNANDLKHDILLQVVRKTQNVESQINQLVDSEAKSQAEKFQTVLVEKMSERLETVGRLLRGDWTQLNNESKFHNAIDNLEKIENQLAQSSPLASDSTEDLSPLDQLTNLENQVREIVADTIESPSMEDLEKRIKHLGGIQSNLQAMPPDGTDNTEEAKELKTSIETRIEQEIKKCEKEIADIKTKKEAAADAARKTEQEEAEKKAREAKEAEEAQKKFDTETGKITSKFTRIVGKIEDTISNWSFISGNLDALKAQVEEATKELEKLREEQLQRFENAGKDNGGQFDGWPDGWPDRIDGITKQYGYVEQQVRNHFEEKASTFLSNIKKIRVTIESLTTPHYLQISKNLLNQSKTELTQEIELAGTCQEEFKSLFETAKQELNLAEVALTVAKKRLESEKLEEAKRLQEAKDEMNRASRAKKEAEDAKADFGAKSNENEEKFFGLAGDIREAIRGREVNLDKLKSQLDDALPQLEQLLKDQTALYSNAKEQFHFANDWRGNIDELQTNYGKKMETFVANVEYIIENLQDKITDITSQLASLTPDGLVSLVSKLEGEFTAIKEEIEREEAKAKKIRKDAEQYFSSVHKQFEAAQKSFEVNQELAKAEMETRKKIERGTDSWFGGNKETDVNPDNTVKETGDTEGAWFQGKTGTGKQEKESPLVKEPTDEPTEKPTDEPTEKPAEKPPKTKSDPLETESDLPETSQDNTIVADSLGFMEDNGFHLLSGYAEHYLSHVKRHDLENLELYECDGVYLWYANDKTRSPAWNLLALMNVLLTKYNGWDCSGRCWRTSTGARRAQQLFSPWSSYGRMVQVLSGERQAHHQGVTGNFKPLELLLRAFGSTDELYSNLQDVCSFEALKHVKNPEFQEAWKTAIMPQVERLMPKHINTDYTELNTRIQSATCMVIGAGYNKVVAMGEEYGRLEENFPGYVGFADLPGNVTGTNVELANHPDMTLDASKPQGENAQRAINYVNGVWDAMKSYKPKGFHSAVIDRCVHNACAQEESDSTVMIWRNNCYAEHVINKLLCADRPIFFIENYSTTPFNDIIYRMTARKAFPDHRVFFGLDSVTDNIDFHEEDFLHQLDENGPSYKLDNDLRAIDAKDIPKSTYSIHCARYDGRNPVELYDQNESDLRQSKHQHRMQIDSEFEKEVIRKKEFEVFCQSYQSYVQENQPAKSDNIDITELRQAHEELDNLRTQIREADENNDTSSAIKLYIEYLTKQEGHFETFTGKDPKQFEYYVAIDRQGFSYAVLQAELLITDPPTADPTHKQQK